MFTKVVCGPQLLLRFRGFVIHLPAVASVFISMPIRCVHMLSRSSAISGHWTLSHLVAVLSYDMEIETLEGMTWSRVCTPSVVFLVLQITCEFLHPQHKHSTNGCTSANFPGANSGYNHRIITYVIIVVFRSYDIRCILLLLVMVVAVKD